MNVRQVDITAHTAARTQLVDMNAFARMEINYTLMAGTVKVRFL